MPCLRACLGLLLFIAPLWGHGACHFSSREKAVEKLEGIKETSKTYDVGTSLAKFETGIADCGWDLESDFGMTPADRRRLVTQSENNFLDQMKAKIQDQATVSDDSFEALEYYANEKGKMSAELRSFVAKEKTAYQARKTANEDSIKTGWKAGCHSVNQMSKLPPVRDQGKLGWCYAFTAADLLSFELGKSVSPFDVALGYNDESYAEYLRKGDPLPSHAARYSREGGFTGRALSSVRARGICLESDLPSDVVMGNENLKTTLGVLSDSRPAPMRGPLECELEVLRKRFPGVDPKTFREIASRAAEGAVVAELANISCGRRTPFPQNLEIVNRKYEAGSTRKADVLPVADLQSSLNEGRIVEISVDMKKWGVRSQEQPSHSMLVVGQKWDERSGRCQFLVRNSWGKQCPTFQSGTTCNPDGSVWVPPDLLNQSVFMSTELKRK